MLSTRILIYSFCKFRSLLFQHEVDNEHFRQIFARERTCLIFFLLVENNEWPAVNPLLHPPVDSPQFLARADDWPTMGKVKAGNSVVETPNDDDFRTFQT